MKHQLIMESWRKFLKEDQGTSKDPGDIYDLGDLMVYFSEIDPSNLQKMGKKYGTWVAKALALASGVAVDVMAGGMTGGAGSIAATSAAGSVGEDVLEKMLLASVVAFANIPDDTYEGGDGSAASLFDIDDTISTFLRGTASRGKDFLTPSQIEVESFTKMKEIVNQKVSTLSTGQGDSWKRIKLSDIINDTAQEILDQELLDVEKVEIEPQP
jgi:hypothetical protein